MLHREGCDSNVGGHVSARAEDREGAFWVTGFEYFDTTVPDRVALLDFDLNPIQGALALVPHPDPGRAGDVSRGQLPRPHLPRPPRRERHRPPPLALHLGAVVG